MADFLSESEWKKELKKNDKLSGTGISEALRDIAKAASRKDHAAQLKALEELREKVGKVRGKQSSNKELLKYLDGMVSAAKEAEQSVERLLASSGDDVDEGAKIGAYLLSVLPRVRRLTADAPWHFVVAQGKPPGLFITRGTITAAHVDRAKEARTGSGTVLKGTCYGEEGVIVFDLGDVAPPPGLAKRLKEAIKLHANLNAKVVARGGGAQIDDELEEQAEGVSNPQPTYGETLSDEQAYRDRLKRVAPLLNSALGAPGAPVPALRQAFADAGQQALERRFGEALRTLEALQSSAQEALDAASRHVTDWAGAHKLELSQLKAAGAPQLQPLLVLMQRALDQGRQLHWADAAQAMEEFDQLIATARRAALAPGLREAAQGHLAERQKALFEDWARGLTPELQRLRSESHPDFARVAQLVKQTLAQAQQGQFDAAGQGMAEADELLLAALTSVRGDEVRQDTAGAFAEQVAFFNAWASGTTEALGELKQAGAPGLAEIAQAIKDTLAAAKAHDWNAALAAMKTGDDLIAAALRQLSASRVLSELAPGTADAGETYRIRRRAVEDRLQRARTDPALQAEVDDRLQKIEARVGEGQFVNALHHLDLLIARLQDRGQALRAELDKVYEDADPNLWPLSLEKDADRWRADIVKVVKSWDHGAAAAEIARFREAVRQARRALPVEAIDLRGLKDVQTRHKEAGLQNAAFARNTEQARSAALRIVREDGTLSIEQLPELMRDLPFSRSDENLHAVLEEVGQTGVEHLPPSKHTARMLEKLRDDPELRDALTAIRAPAPDSPASDMIRATLGLPADAVLTDAHARRAATTALLTQIRQADAGSCFATSVAIGAQTRNPKRFLQDLESLFGTGKVTRTIDGKTVEARLNADMSTSDLERKHKVNRDASGLEQTPAFRAALTSLGIAPKDQKGVIDQALSDLLGNDAEGEIQPQALIDMLVRNHQAANQLGDEEAARLRTAGRQAFQGQQDNRLLRAWEYTVASLVEDDERAGQRTKTMKAEASKSIRDQLAASANQVLSAGGAGGANAQAVYDGLKAEVDRQLGSALKVVYDASYKTPPSPDGSSSRGVWHYQRADTGEKIADGASFKKLAAELMRQALAQFPADPEKSLAERFVERMIADFNPADAPRGGGGHSSQDMISVFYGHDTAIEMDKIDVTSTDGLMEWVIGRGDAMNRQYGDDIRAEPETAGTLMRNSVHAFNFRPGSAPLQGLASDQESTPREKQQEFKNAEKAKNRVVRATALPLNDPIDGPVKELVDRATSYYHDTVQPLVRAAIAQKLRALGKKEVTAGWLGRIIQKAVDEYQPGASNFAKRKSESDKRLALALMDTVAPPVPAGQLDARLDKVLATLKVPEGQLAEVKKKALAALPGGKDADMSALKKAVDEALTAESVPRNADNDSDRIFAALKPPAELKGLVFADSNWGDGDHTTLLTLLVNPLTDEVELWKMNEDGSNPNPLDATKWVQGTNWSVPKDPGKVGGIL